MLVGIVLVCRFWSVREPIEGAKDVWLGNAGWRLRPCPTEESVRSA
jgi:hypothetical protein